MKLSRAWSVLVLGTFPLSTAVLNSQAFAADTIRIDGSSTVYPITEAVAEEFRSEAASLKVTIGVSGTGGGFKKFCSGETDISNASRPIKQTEVAACSEKGIKYIELPIAYDALTVVVNPSNAWASSMTLSELKTMWEPAAQGTIKTWKQVNPAWPDKPLKLFGPGVDSGTYDYFTEVVMGKEDQSRGDYTSSEDDNVLVQGVAGETGGLGFFGFSYYQENKDKLKAVAIDDGNSDDGAGAILPSVEHVTDGTYKPFSRPLFIYISIQSLSRPEVKQFVDFYLKNAGQLASEVGFIALPADVEGLVRARLEKRTEGSLYSGTSASLSKPLKQALSE